MSLTQIYGTFNRAMLRVVPHLRAYSDTLTNAMVEFMQCHRWGRRRGRREGNRERGEEGRIFLDFVVLKFIILHFFFLFFLPFLFPPSLPSFLLSLSFSFFLSYSLLSFSFLSLSSISQVLVKWLTGSVGSMAVWNSSRVSRLKDLLESRPTRHSSSSKTGEWVWL